MKESRCSSTIIHKKSVLTWCKAEFGFLCFFFFFQSSFFFHEYSRFTGQQVKGKAISCYPFFHFHTLYRHLDISRVIATESSPLRRAGSRTRARNLWYTLCRVRSFFTCTGSCLCQENA